MRDEIIVRQAKAAAAAEKAAADAVTAAEAAATAAEAAALLVAATVEDSVALACLKRDLAMADQGFAEERAAGLAAGLAAADLAVPAPVRSLFDTVRIIAPTRNYWQF
jgi:hypothetical protein